MLIFLSMILPVMLQALKLHMMSSGTKTGAIKDGMKLKKLGSSDLMVSEICLGTMTWGVQNTMDEGCAQMDYYFDECGGNFMDTAEMYAFDVSYESLYLLIIFVLVLGFAFHVDNISGEHTNILVCQDLGVVCQCSMVYPRI